MMTNNQSESQIRWSCRRGMLELDLMLIPFAEQQYPKLSPSQQLIFQKLLQQQDPELFSWLLGNEKPQEQSLADMVEMVRNYARAKLNL